MTILDSPPVVIDTSVLVGVLYPRDHRHTQAQALVNDIVDAGYGLVYFDCVVAETISVIVRRAEEQHYQGDIAVLFQLLKTRIPAENITWIFDGVSRLYDAVLDMMQTSNGTLNFNDALIALACQQRNILSIASFDTDFDQISWLRRLPQS